MLGDGTKPAYTEAYGIVLVEHSSIRNADVHLWGTKAGSFHAPGEIAVFIP